MLAQCATTTVLGFEPFTHCRDDKLPLLKMLDNITTVPLTADTISTKFVDV